MAGGTPIIEVRRRCEVISVFDMAVARQYLGIRAPAGFRSDGSDEELASDKGEWIMTGAGGVPHYRARQIPEREEALRQGGARVTAVACSSSSLDVLAAILRDEHVDNQRLQALVEQYQAKRAGERACLQNIEQLVAAIDEPSVQLDLRDVLEDPDAHQKSVASIRDRVGLWRRSGGKRQIGGGDGDRVEAPGRAAEPEEAAPEPEETARRTEVPSAEAKGTKAAVHACETAGELAGGAPKPTPKGRRAEAAAREEGAPEDHKPVRASSPPPSSGEEAPGHSGAELPELPTLRALFGLQGRWGDRHRVAYLVQGRTVHVTMKEGQQAAVKLEQSGGRVWWLNRWYVSEENVREASAEACPKLVRLRWTPVSAVDKPMVWWKSNN